VLGDLADLVQALIAAVLDLLPSRTRIRSGQQAVEAVAPQRSRCGSESSERLLSATKRICPGRAARSMAAM